MVVGNLNASEGCDVVVIGAGPGGYVCAIRAAQLGKDVILVEKEKTLGGVCLNEGCIPSKALIHASEVYEQMQHADTMGLNLASPPTLDLSKTQAWKAGIVKRLTGGVASLEKMHGVRVMEGTASFVTGHQLEVTSSDGRVQTVDFSHAVIATGSVPLKLPPVPHDGTFVIGSREALELTELPKHMVVIGGGYIGLELGTAYRKLGAEVTVVELQKQLLGGGLEPEINKLLERRAKKLGMTLLMEHKAVEAGKGKLIVEDKEGNKKELETDCILVAIGRKPNTEGLNLKAIGLETDAQGFLAVDDARRTAIPHIFAIGDVAGQPMLAHKAYREAKVAAEVIAGHPSAYDVRVVPAVMFTDPEIASVGMTEAQAKEAGYEVKTGVFPWNASGRAMTLSADGVTKIISDAATERLLGVHIAGAHAAELLGEGTLALELDAFVDDIAHTIHAHPTLSESVAEAAELIMGSCAHFKSR